MNALIKDVEFRDLRLPYIPDLADSFGIDNVRWKVLIDSIFPAATSVDSIVMALSYCRARNLDIMKRPVHIVPMWSTAQGKMVETVWPSIAELRTTAFRTGQYAGCEAAEFGPSIDAVFSGKANRGASKGVERKVSLVYPEWCRLVVTRLLAGREYRFVGPKVIWTEAYARWVDTDVPNETWSKRVVGQIEKCAEAAALRRAFPEELGNEYAAEEMEGQRLFSDTVETPLRPPVPPKPPQIAHSPAIPMETVARPEAAAVVVPPKPSVPPRPPAAGASRSVAATASDVFDFEALRKRFAEAVKSADDVEALTARWDSIVVPTKDKLTQYEEEDLMGVWRAREGELEQ